MNIEFELVEETPVHTEKEELPIAIRSPVEDLFRSYEEKKESIITVTAYMADRDSNVLEYFFAAARVNDRWAATLQADRLFDKDAAIAALDAEHWQQAILLTDVLEVMPAERRQEWTKYILEHTTPSFDRDAVISTLRDLLLQREVFFCERIDGLFRNLSGNHVTNVPEGFSKRMIMGNWISYGTFNWEKIDFIHDLRFVIARFMGRESPDRAVTSTMVSDIYRTNRYGEWHVFDGGAFRFKLYKKGTAHIEIHPTMAWRLNAMLAKLYPSAIPASRRKKETIKKEYSLSEDHLNESVVVLLSSLQFHDGGKSLSFPIGRKNITGKPTGAHKEAETTLSLLGGVKTAGGDWMFEYNVREVLMDVIRSGRLPDDSYQFYPTPDDLARIVLDHAEIQDDDTVLEPSAGQGALASFVDASQVTCIEVSPLFCSVLQAKGYSVEQGDFLEMAPKEFSKIIMNPPFSNGRAEQHVRQAAMNWLAPGGRLVAILPASLKGKTLVDGANHTYSEVHRNLFERTGVAVTVLILQT